MKESSLPLPSMEEFISWWKSPPFGVKSVALHLGIPKGSVVHVTQRLIDLGLDYESLKAWSREHRSETFHPSMKEAREGFRKKYGVCNPMELSSVKAKFDYSGNAKKGQETCKKNNGYRTPFELSSVHYKRNETVRKEKSYPRILALANQNGLEVQTPESNYSPGGEIHVKCLRCGYPYSFVGHSTMNLCPKCHEHGQRSTRELTFQEYLGTVGIDAIHGSKLLGRYDVDVYLPSLKIGFEFNGYYWHSSAFHSSVYHREKSDLAQAKGIKLYHIWEDWPSSIEKSLVSNRQKLFARKCSLQETSASAFYTKYHALGDCSGGYTITLSFNGEIVAAMTVRDRFGSLENVRYCVHPDYQIVGGFSRLMSAIKRKFPGRILLSYCDRDLSPIPEDTVYYRYGFTFLGDSGPSMSYYATKNVEGIERGKHSRQSLQKHLLSKFSWYKSTLTEQENLEQVGVYAVYNSGNWKFSIQL